MEGQISIQVTGRDRFCLQNVSVFTLMEIVQGRTMRSNRQLTNKE